MALIYRLDFLLGIELLKIYKISSLVVILFDFDILGIQLNFIT